MLQTLIQSHKPIAQKTILKSDSAAGAWPASNAVSQKCNSVHTHVVILKKHKAGQLKKMDNEQLGT